MTEGQKSNSETQKVEQQPVNDPNLTKPVEKDNTNQEGLKLKALEDQIETLKRQYKGSTEEALRLKEEVDRLKSSSTSKIDEQSFQKRIEEVGYVQATREMLDAALEPIRTKTDSLFKEKVDSTLSSFKQKHPGLNGDNLAKFDKEFDRLKKVYSDPVEAMEAAYRVIGGETFDRVATEEANKLKEKSDALNKSEKEKDALVSKASGGDLDSRPVPKNSNQEIQNQINTLKAMAVKKEQTGQEADDLWVKIENLQATLKG